MSFNTINEIALLIKKEFLIEFRLKSALFSLLLYIGGTVFLIYLSFKLKTSEINPITWNTLYWIIMLFIAFNTVAKSFIQESRNRDFYYYYVVSPEGIIISKMIYNTILMIVFSLVTLLFYSVVLGNPIENFFLFFCTTIIAGIGFGAGLTLVSGIASKTNNNAVLMAVLSIPVIMPLLLLLIKVSQHAVDGLDISLIYKELMILGLLDLIMVVSSVILFPYLWRN